VADGLTVRQATAAELGALRATRLRALEDAPYAFASRLEREQALGEDDWRARLAERAWFLAWRGNNPVGMVGCFAEKDRPATYHLTSLWVEPPERGGAAATALVDTVLARAAEEQAGTVALWVVDTNARARRFYVRMGFTPTGRRQPFPSDPSVGEQELRRPVRASPLRHPSHPA
jgi:ribosomal protein S18 acetylase RimI-like enzyme